MSDTYRELVERLRDGVTQPSDGGEATRQRILHDLSQRKPRARRPRTLLLLAAALFVSTAFALYIASPVARETGAVRRRAVSVAAPVAPSPAPAPRVAPAMEAPAQPQVPPPVEPAPGIDASQPVTPVRRRPSRRASDAAPALAPAPASDDAAVPSSAPSAAPAPAPEAAPVQVTPQQRQMRYIEAHRQHFRGSPQQALAAWDAFLASNPGGPPLLEARYNRAVTLVRLGRRAEAERALAPFARGEHGSFRQAEAQQLLQQLAR